MPIRMIRIQFHDQSDFAESTTFDDGHRWRLDADEIAAVVSFEVNLDERSAFTLPIIVVGSASSYDALIERAWRDLKGKLVQIGKLAEMIGPAQTGETFDQGQQP